MEPTLIAAEASHLHGGTILRHDFTDEYIDLREVLAAVDIPLRSGAEFSTDTRPLKPKRQLKSIGGRKLPALMPADLPALNSALDTSLKARGWDSQPIATDKTMTETAAVLGLKGDFVKNKVFVEVEFGNIASLHRDLFKFQIANRAGVGDVGVLVTAMDRLARFHDQGITTYEAAVRLLPYLAVGIQMPIWIIGIEPADWSPLKSRYEEMLALCQDHGVSCHPFEGVYVEGPELRSESGDVAPDLK